jgi:hypothetical protein
MLSTRKSKNHADHPIDIVALYRRYCKLMGFPTDQKGREFERTRKAPFFQEVANGKPTGEPMQYATLLAALKHDIDMEFPELDAADYGTHSFRRFGATLARTQGIPDDMIKLMGRWQSDCFQMCFMFSEDDKVEANRGMLS